ncbi:MAG: hypothetical protein R3A52_19715 [Polyangiales bacterium]
MAFATRAFGQVQSVSVLDLHGTDPSSARRDHPRAGDRTAPRHRWDLRLDRAVRALDLRFEGRRCWASASRAGRWR